MALSYADVGEILKMIDKSSCEEVVLELDGIKMVVRKGQPGALAAANSMISNSIQSSDVSHAKNDTPASAETQFADRFGTGELTTGKGEIINSPMVGTYFSKPSPEDQPFVAVGQRVKKGDTLCLIEVMKLYTAVESAIDGTVETIFVEEGALVEFDQPLFSII